MAEDRAAVAGDVLAEADAAVVELFHQHPARAAFFVEGLPEQVRLAEGSARRSQDLELPVAG